MILIDALYIHSHGGLTILDSFLNGLEETQGIYKEDFHFFIDDRIDPSFMQRFKNYSFEKLSSNHFNRKKLYQEKINLVKKVVCLSNIPPPIKVYKPVYIYFHNLLLLNNKINYVTPYFFVLNILKLAYIKFFNVKSYKWIVQTNYMKIRLSRKLNIYKTNINIFPFFDDNDLLFEKKDFNSKSLNFLCVTSNSKHKNLNTLVKSFINAELDLNKNYTLYITTNGDNLTHDNKHIIYLGYTKREKIRKYYSKSQYIIFPSLVESFGLPIIEGIKSGCNILISNIESLKEVCIPSLSFDPSSIEEITHTIERAGNLSNCKSSKLTIKNEINNFIKLINEDV